MTVVLIVGSSDLGSACALRLFRSGFQIIILEKTPVFDIHIKRTFSSAYYNGFKTISGLTARTHGDAVEKDILAPESTVGDFIKYQLANREIPFISHQDAGHLRNLDINFAVAANDNLIKDINHQLPDFCKYIGFAQKRAADGYHYHIYPSPPYRGRVIYPFEDAPAFENASETDRNESCISVQPENEGLFNSLKDIGETVEKNEKLARVGLSDVKAPAAGKITGMLNSGILIEKNTVIAEIDTSAESPDGMIIPERHFALAGGALEAILYDRRLNEG